MRVVQVHLTQPSEHGIRHLYCWIPEDPRIKPGVWFDLDKVPGDQWQVEEMFGTGESTDINMKWGLELPKSQRTER